MKISHAKKLAAALNKDFKQGVLNEYQAKVIDTQNPAHPLSRAEIIIIMDNSYPAYCGTFFNHLKAVFTLLGIDPLYHITEDGQNQNSVDFILTIF